MTLFTYICTCERIFVQGWICIHLRMHLYIWTESKQDTYIL
jgi:hypothetical protein